MEIPLYVADTPCVIRMDRDDHISGLYALDGGGPDRGPRRVSLTRELAEEIRRYIKEVVNAAGSIAPRDAGDVRGEIPPAGMGDNQEAAQAVQGGQHAP